MQKICPAGRLAVLFLGLSLFSGPLEAQERRVIPVSVVDKHGKFVEGLTEVDFRGEYRGQEVTIISVALDVRPRRIAVLLDTSGSMGEKSLRKFVWSVAATSADLLSQENSISFLLFSKELSEAVAWDSEPGELMGRLNRLYLETPSEGRTAVLSAVERAADGFPGPGFADVLYLISDGEDNASRTKKKNARIRLAQSGVRLFYACLDPIRGGTVEWSNGLRNCRDLAESSGGAGIGIPVVWWNWKSSFVPAVTGEEMLPRVQTLLNSMVNTYRLEVEFPTEIDKPREWKLEVVDARGKRRKDLTLAYPKLLVPPEDSAKQ